MQQSCVLRNRPCSSQDALALILQAGRLNKQPSYDQQLAYAQTLCFPPDLQQSGCWACCKLSRGVKEHQVGASHCCPSHQIAPIRDSRMGHHQAHPWHDLSVGESAPELVHAVIEIPRYGQRMQLDQCCCVLN